MTKRRLVHRLLFHVFLLLAASSGHFLHAATKLPLEKGDRITLVGAGMGSRMVHYGHFETELHLRFPNKELTIRNLCDEGNTPGFRPHPGREQNGQYAFPGAKELISSKLQATTGPRGHFETPDQWLTRLKSDVVLAFFGFNSSFDDPRELGRFKKELDAFLKHTAAQKYNGKSAPRIALISPTAIQPMKGVTNGSLQNANLILYVEAMREVAKKNGILFVDAYSPSAKWYGDGQAHTVDGALLRLGIPQARPLAGGCHIRARKARGQAAPCGSQGRHGKELLLAERLQGTQRGACLRTKVQSVRAQELSVRTEEDA
tara:strand:- start:1139 stop:2089 length:951 start_codon:yes stop_codon:yes gene_type:complete